MNKYIVCVTIDGQDQFLTTCDGFDVNPKRARRFPTAEWAMISAEKLARVTENPVSLKKLL